MALYEYECEACGAITEKECKFAERYNAPACRECGGDTHQVIRTAPTFTLKGGGVGWADRSYSGSGGKKTP